MTHPPPPPPPPMGGLPLPPHAKRDLAIAEAAEAFTLLCEQATATLKSLELAIDNR